jgi:hypothetical protein
MGSYAADASRRGDTDLVVDPVLHQHCAHPGVGSWVEVDHGSSTSEAAAHRRCKAGTSSFAVSNFFKILFVYPLRSENKSGTKVYDFDWDDNSG